MDLYPSAVKFSDIFFFQASRSLQEELFSATDLCKACLKRAKLIKPLNPFITITEEKALNQAASADERLKHGKHLYLNLTKYKYWVEKQNYISKKKKKKFGFMQQIVHNDSLNIIESSI